MRTYGLIVGTLVLMVFTASALSQSQTDLAKGETSCNDKSSKIMILGTYHMDNPGLDSVNLNATDQDRDRGPIPEHLLPQPLQEISDGRTEAWEKRNRTDRVPTSQTP